MSYGQGMASDSKPTVEIPEGAPSYQLEVEDGVAGMRVGGRRRITIPPAMGYGKRGFPPVIKPDETLVFVVDLIGVR